MGHFHIFYHSGQILQQFKIKLWKVIKAKALTFDSEIMKSVDLILIAIYLPTHEVIFMWCYNKSGLERFPQIVFEPKATYSRVVFGCDHPSLFWFSFYFLFSNQTVKYKSYFTNRQVGKLLFDETKMTKDGFCAHW